MRRTSLFGLFVSIGALGCGGAMEASPPPPPPPDTTIKIASDEKEADEEKAEDGTANKRYAVKGAADKDPLGSLEGDEIGDAFGAGGLGLVGVGEGGGGRGEGIGLGNVGTFGHGAGTGTGQGFGGGSGRLGGGQSGSKARVSAATATTTGAGLPAEVIQRVVRTRLGVIRACYEKAMTKDAALAGKIAVKFTIDAQGAVATATASDTTIPDADMVSCVVGAVRGLSFPQPENGGVLVVTYPFNFSPGDP